MSGEDIWLGDSLNGLATNKDNCKKIILTTDQDLIAGGVQSIDDEFLEWFIKNSSCEEVEVVFNNRGITGTEKILKTFGEYKIIIPKEEPNPFELPKALPDDVFFKSLEEPKQETLEEATEILSKDAYKKHSVKDNNLSLDEQIQRSGGFIVGFKEGMNEGANWQAKRMYSEEEVMKLWNWLNDGFIMRKSLPTREELIGWFEQFRKK
jgi:hypothetical protein